MTTTIISSAEDAIKKVVHSAVEHVENAVHHVETEAKQHVESADETVMHEATVAEQDTSAIIQSLVFKCENGISRIDIRLHHAAGEVRSIVLNGEHTIEKLISRIREMVK